MNFKILALDASTEMCSVALYHQGEITYKEQISPREHAQTILPLINQLLIDSGITLKALDAIALGAGPGSFTGVRIGVSVAQGLAFGANLPLLPVSTLKALAQGAYRRTGIAHVLSAIDARMGEIYWGQYQRLATGEWQAKMPECVISPEVLMQHQLDCIHWVTAGTGWQTYPELFKHCTLSSSGHLYPLAQDIIPIACVDFARKLTKTAAEIEPIYLRNEVTWKKLPGRD